MKMVIPMKVILWMVFLKVKGLLPQIPVGHIKENLKNGQPDGQGTLTAQNGEVYTGTFKQGIFQK